jgi:release factor glutamine methyltransferase
MAPPEYDDLVLRLRSAGSVFAEDEARLLLGEASGARLEELVARRVAGEPLEHLVGWVEFCGLRVRVGPGVFVPRQRTSYLVEMASRRISGRAGSAIVVDLCCGSGAIGLAIATRHPAVELHAADVDPVAVACARHNLEPVGGRVHLGDLDAPLPARLRGRVDVLVANVPYVPSEAVALMPPESRDHEPRATVDGGADGLDVVRRLTAAAPGWLAPGGSVLVETGADQVPAAVAAIADAGLRAEAHESDEHETWVVVGVA